MILNCRVEESTEYERAYGNEHSTTLFPIVSHFASCNTFCFENHSIDYINQTRTVQWLLNLFDFITREIDLKTLFVGASGYIVRFDYVYQTD